MKRACPFAFWRFSMLALVGSILLPSAESTEASWDLHQAPTEAQLEEILQLPPEEGAAKIREALTEQYRPARGTSHGSSGQPGFVQWMRLLQWLDLMGRTDEQEFARFLGPMVMFSEREGKQVVVYRLPPWPFGEEGVEVPLEIRQQWAADPGVRGQYLSLLIPSDFQWRGAILEEYLGRERARRWARNPEFLEEFFSVLSPRDFTPGVLQNLARLEESDPEGFAKLPALALALAVVFDQKPPAEWPHHQVSPASLPADKQTLEQRFAYWKGLAEGRELAVNAGELGADQWRFVVDALVAPEELDWARRHVRTPRTSFGRTFSSIRYDQDRLRRQQFSWPKGVPYTLEAIQKAGGICVDQAYFAMMAGKARGIPTLFFVGQGADGGHAWFGYLRSPDRWDLDAGRYENQNYAVGHALDPQSWEHISDHELQLLSQRVRRTLAFRHGLIDLLVAGEFSRSGDLEKAGTAVRSALGISPQNPDAWTAQTDLLLTTEAAPDVLRRHWEEAAKNFNAVADLRAYYTRRLADLARAEGDDRRAATLQTQMIRQNQRQRADLSVSMLAEQINGLMAQGDTAGAVREFRSQAPRLARTGGGAFFYEVAKPLVEYLLEKDDPQEAKRMVDLARRVLSPDRGSILDQELSNLEGLTDPRRR